MIVRDRVGIAALVAVAMLTACGTDSGDNIAQIDDSNTVQTEGSAAQVEGSHAAGTEDGNAGQTEGGDAVRNESRDIPQSEDRDVTPIAEFPSALAASTEAVLDAAVGFGIELAARIAAEEPRANIVLSPISAALALAMTMNGASGETFEAMRAGLGLGTLTQEQLNAAYREWIDFLTQLDPSVRLEIANGVWANEGVPFHDAFLQAVEANFRARIESRSFADSETLDEINNWVAEHTDGMIDSILDGLDPALVMLLVNAVYFEGAWTTEFDTADTRRTPFQREDGSVVDVDMMSVQNIELLRARGDDYSAIEVPYGNEMFAMVLVLPDAGIRARDWLAMLDAEAWRALIERLAPDRLNLVSLPKFTLSFDVYLNSALQAMSMDPAFMPGADFTRMSPLGQQMCIDYVRQKARIEVDERGTRAAAATSVGIGVVSFNGFIADRPFVLMIRERTSNSVLFVGLVGDPTAEDPGPEPLVSDCTGAALP